MTLAGLIGAILAFVVITLMLYMLSKEDMESPLKYILVGWAVVIGLVLFIVGATLALEAADEIILF